MHLLVKPVLLGVIVLLGISFIYRQSKTPLPTYSASSFGEHDPYPGVDGSRGPLDPYAEKVFLMLKSGATVVQNRIHPHVHSTLRRWPQHAVYADVETRINGIDVIDIFKWLPEFIFEDEHLDDYLVLTKSVKERWQWELDGLSKYEGWALDMLKNVPMVAHAWQTAPETTDWYFFIDMDTYVFQRGLLDYLKELDPNQVYYLGRPAEWTTDAQTKSGEKQIIRFAHGGSGVILSKAAMYKLFGAKDDKGRHGGIINYNTKRAQSHCCGDALLAIMLYEHAGEKTIDIPWGEEPTYNQPFQGSTPRDIAVGRQGWCLPYFSWHHLTPREVNMLYDYEEQLPRNQSAVTFDQLYHDFILPYVVPERTGWDALAGHVHGDWERKNSILYYDDSEFPENLTPTASKEECRRACEANGECLLWVYEDQRRCQLMHGAVMRGMAANPLKKGVEKSLISGWMVDRIRELRANAPCDPLTRAEDGTWNDNEETSEGWFVRKLHAKESVVNTVRQLEAEEQRQVQETVLSEEDQRNEQREREYDM